MQSSNKIVVFLLLLVLLLMSRAGFGQTNNTFPFTGNAGIGTTSPINALDIYGNNKRISIRSQTLNAANRPGIIFGKNDMAFFAGDSTTADQRFDFYSVWSSNRTYNAEIRIFGNSPNSWTKYLGLKRSAAIAATKFFTHEIKCMTK